MKEKLIKENSINYTVGNWKVGDKVKLICKEPFAGLKKGQIGVITSIEDLHQFSVNGYPGCNANISTPYWEIIKTKNKTNMKTDFKVGQTVWSKAFGKGIVSKILKNEEFPIRVLFDNKRTNSYKYDGRSFDGEYAPCLLTYDPLDEFEIPVIDLSKSKTMECALNSSFAKTIDCNIIAKFIDEKKTVHYLTRDVISLTGKVIYNHVREIKQKPVELTMDEIAKEFGIDVNLLKIVK